MEQPASANGLNIGNIAKSLDRDLAEEKGIVDEAALADTGNVAVENKPADVPQTNKIDETNANADNTDAPASITQRSIPSAVPTHTVFFDEQEKLYQQESQAQKHSNDRQLKSETPAPGYAENSLKEDSILQYISNFQRQFTQLYTGRKELLLCPRNEFGAQVIYSNCSFINNRLEIHLHLFANDSTRVL